LKTQELIRNVCDYSRRKGSYSGNCTRLGDWLR